MPRFSRFTPLGLYRLSGRKPTAKVIYDQIIAGYGDKPQRDLAPGSRDEAMVYAQAITDAIAYETIERAGNERLPTRTLGMLEVHEAARGIVAPANATIRDRRAELARRWKLPAGARRQAVEDGLRDILGSHFVRYQTQDISAFVPRYPSAIGSWPMSLQDPKMTRKLVRLTQPVAFTGTQVAVRYEVIAGSPLVAGDVVVFDVGRHGLMDRVAIDAASKVGSTTSLVASFQSTHSPGAFGVTGTVPYWMSKRRFVYVVVDTTAAGDRELRRRVNEYMARTMRAVTTWAIVEDDGHDGLKTFKIGAHSIGRRAIGA